MNALTLCIRLLQPVLVAQAQSSEENSAIGHSFLPGSALRGALVARYLERHAVKDLAGDARPLFFDGSVRFLNAYPCPDGKRMLPTPLSWFTEKGEPEPIYDLAARNVVMKNPKGVDVPFCRIEYEDGDAASPQVQARARFPDLERQVDVHITLEDQNDRTDENLVYRYDALAEGQVFMAVILAATEELRDEIEQLLEPRRFLIGRALTAGYGQVEVDVQRAPGWQEYPQGPPPADGQVIVTLLSDALLRNKGGQGGGDVDAALAGALGVDGLQWKAAYRRLHVVGGFNRKWSLPLTQSWALAAGSVYVAAPGVGEREAMRRRAADGVGERRVEGFGRLALNWHTAPSPQPDVPEASPVTLPVLSDSSRDLAGRMANRQLRTLLERALARQVNETVITGVLPENAQLSRVRTAAQAALRQNNLQKIGDHLDSLKSAREQFERARIGGQELGAWIRRQASGLPEQEDWVRQVPLPRVAQVPAQLSRELWVEFTARYIDGVMKKAIKGKPGTKKTGKGGKEAV